LGLFAIRDPKVHSQQRKLFSRPFSKTELRRYWEGVVRDKIRMAVGRIRDEAMASEGRIANVYKWWTFLASDVFAHVVFGESFHMLELGEVSPS